MKRQILILTAFLALLVMFRTQAAQKGYKTYLKAVSNTSASLATVLGEALPGAVEAVTIINHDPAVDLNVQTDGNAASATSGRIPAGGGWLKLGGNKLVLDDVRLYAASSVNVTVIVWVSQ
jgi:hypothetical protein